MTTRITKTWFDGGKVVTKEIPESEVYKQKPVAWMDEFGNVFPLGAQRGPKYLNEPMKPLYTTPPAAPVQEPVQEPVTEAQKRADFERFWVTEIGDKDDLTYGGLGYAINRVAVAWKAWKAAAQPCPYIRSTAEGTHHCALANQTKEQA